MTKRSVLGALVLAGLFSSTTAFAQTTTIAGELSGANEIPPIASAGVGRVVCTVDRATQVISCDALVFNIVDLTAFHIHVGGPGANGPVVLNGSTSNSDVPFGASDDIRIRVRFTATDLALRTAEGVLKMADVIEACVMGGCYFNLHTRANPGGALRAQLMPLPAGLPGGPR